MTPDYSCRGPVPPNGIGRRAFLQTGLAGFASLSLPGLLKLRSRASDAPATGSGEKKAVIMVWQPGGLSHIDSYDPKPDSGSEYAGPFKPIATKVTGLKFTELLPRHAAIADKMVVLRSMRQTAGGHPAGSMQLLSGDPDTRDKPKPKYPDWMAVSNYMLAQKGPRKNPLPAYVGINPPLEYNGPAYLGDAYSPFVISGDPNAPTFSVPNIGLTDADQVGRIGRRSALRQQLDTLDRSFDHARELGALDEFESQAMGLLTNPQTKIAFDLSREDARTRDRYGRNAWGQQLLLARRLVEAGVDVLTTSLSGPLCGRVQNWDDHAVNHNVFEAMKFRAEVYDRAVSALIEDVYQRGLDKRVLVVVTGEFGRTPKISYAASTGAGDASAPAGTSQPGRDHWPRGFSNIWAGGGITPGRFVGATDKRGEDAVERVCGPGDFLATIYQHLGIDYAKTFIKDFNGRPTAIVDHGKAIPELTG
ncbi:MAG: DUF1501 domain-containing protein [Planctomycetes bacterium]|nr:DUF1501 domain-containing protein [Planctomycetota bacterium]